MFELIQISFPDYNGVRSQSLVFILQEVPYETFGTLASNRLGSKLRNSGCESERVSVRTWYCFVCKYRWNLL